MPMPCIEIGPLDKECLCLARWITPPICIVGFVKPANPPIQTGHPPIPYQGQVPFFGCQDSQPTHMRGVGLLAMLWHSIVIE